MKKITIDGSPTRELKALQELDTPKNEKSSTRMNKNILTVHSSKIHYQ